MRVSNTSPALTATIGPRAPESTRSPARNGCPREDIVRASHTTALSGLPRQAAPAPTDTGSPRLVMAMPHSVRSTRPPVSRCFKHVGARRRVVRDGIHVADVPVRDAAADDLECGEQVVDCLDDVDVPGVRHVQIAAKHEGDLRLDLRLLQTTHRNRFGVAEAHVVEEDAEVGLVHAELRLHCLGSQPDLAADDAAAFVCIRCSVLARWTA